MVFAFLPGASATSVATTPSSDATLVWAYGQTRSVTIHPLSAPDGWQYEGSVKMGYSVILSQTNGTAGANTIGLSVGQAQGVSIALEFCRPSCSSPLVYANLSMRAWERSNTSANFTTAGSVEENGAAVPALALIDANSTGKANVTESTFSALRSTPGGPIVDRSKYLSAAVASHAGVTFTPALGLVPLGIASLEGTNASWSSNSSFSAMGAVVSTYYYAFHGPVVGNLTFGPATVSRAFQPSGNVSIQGSFASPASVVLGSLGSFPAIELSVIGPFAVEDGIVLLPTAADFFGSLAAHPWAADQATSAVTQLAALDFSPEFDGHLGVAASARSYSLGSANPANLTSPASTNNTLGSFSANPATTTNPVASTTLQGEPLAVPNAESNSNCLVTGVGCATGVSAPRALLATFGVAVVVVAAAALIAAVVIVDRRRLPPPLYPNAPLYPPGAASGSVVAPPTPEPAQEDDPLDHLW